MPTKPHSTVLRAYVAATATNFLGTGVQGVAVPWLLLELTGSAAAVGILLVLRAVPNIVLSSYAGVLADSTSRRRIAVWASTIQGCAVSLVAAAVALGHRDPLLLYAMTAVVGVGNTFFFPATRAFMQSAVDRRAYVGLASMTETAMQLGMIAGTALAGPLIVGVGAAGALAVDALSFLVAAAIFARMPEQAPIEPQSRAPRRTSLAQPLEGLRYIYGRPHLLVAVLLSMIPLVCVQVDNVLVAAFTRDVLGLGAQGFSLINLTYAVGAMTAGATIASWAKRSADRPAFIVVALAALGAAHVSFGISRTGLVAVLAMLAIGLTVVAARSHLAALVMHATDTKLAGRVQASVQLLSGLLVMAIGLSVGGLAEVTGYAAVFGALGALCAGAAIAAAACHRRDAARAMTRGSI